MTNDPTDTKITGVYILTFYKDQPPSIFSLDEGGKIETMRLNGQSYYVVPLTQHTKPPPIQPPRPKVTTPIIHNPTINTCVELYNQGYKVSQIATRCGRSAPWVYKQLQLGGARIGDPKLEEKLIDIILEAPDGVDSKVFKEHHKIVELYPNGRAPIGPCLLRLTRLGEIKRSPVDGKWRVV